MQAYRQMAMTDEEKERLAQESRLALQDEEINKTKAELELIKEVLRLKKEVAEVEGQKEEERQKEINANSKAIEAIDTVNRNNSAIEDKKNKIKYLNESQQSNS